MSDESGDRSERDSPASLTVLFGALVLLVVGGSMSGGIIVAYFEQDGADPGSAAVIFAVGVCLVAIAVFLIRRQ